MVGSQGQEIDNQVLPPMNVANLELNNHQQLGMVLLPDNIDCDPGMSDFMARNPMSPCHADSVRFWAHHFSFLYGAKVVMVPRCWNDFCTLNLMHLDRFSWVKSLTESSAWSLITKDSDIESSFTFTIPKVRPSSSPIQYSSSQEGSQSLEAKADEPISPMQVNNPLITGADPKILKMKDKAPLTVTEVIRSDRIKSNNSGFKAKTCTNKPCLCCDAEPPTLSSKIIKDLGKEFCMIPTKKISEETLKKKTVAKNPTVLEPRQDPTPSKLSMMQMLKALRKRTRRVERDMCSLGLQGCFSFVTTSQSPSLKLFWVMFNYILACNIYGYIVGLVLPGYKYWYWNYQMATPDYKLYIGSSYKALMLTLGPICWYNSLGYAGFFKFPAVLGESSQGFGFSFRGLVLWLSICDDFSWLGGDKAFVRSFASFKVDRIF
jgi:hypothetical protein